MKLFGIFAKHWTPGRVKTRLAAAVGDRAAADFHRVCFCSLLDRFADIAPQQLIGFTPLEKQADFASLAGGRWELLEQTSGDLGHRMAAFFKAGFERAATRVVLIGSDSPTLPAAYVQSAFELLENNEVVLGPSNDGGYYLVGMSRYTPEIFSNICWGSDRVWEATQQRLAEAHVMCAMLPPWYDVDELEDLDRLRDELFRLDGYDALKTVVRDLDELVSKDDKPVD